MLGRRDGGVGRGYEVCGVEDWGRREGGVG